MPTNIHINKYLYLLQLHEAVPLLNETTEANSTADVFK